MERRNEEGMDEGRMSGRKEWVERNKEGRNNKGGWIDGNKRNRKTRKEVTVEMEGRRQERRMADLKKEKERTRKPSYEGIRDRCIGAMIEGRIGERNFRRNEGMVGKQNIKNDRWKEVRNE